MRALVAHEPPAALLLDDPTEALAADWEIHDTYLREGVDAAMARFFAMAALDVGANGAPAPAAFDMTPEDAETFAGSAATSNTGWRTACCRSTSTVRTPTC